FDEGLGEIAYDEKAELVYGNKGYDDHVLGNPEIELSIIDREKPEEREDGAENVEDVEKLQLEARYTRKKLIAGLGKRTMHRYKWWIKRQMQNVIFNIATSLFYNVH